VGEHVTAIDAVLRDLEPHVGRLTDGGASALAVLETALQRSAAAVDKCRALGALGAMWHARDLRGEFQDAQQALLLALGTLQPLAVQPLAGPAVCRLSAARNSLAAMRLEADEGLAALGEQLRAQSELLAAQRGDIAGLAALLRGMALGTPAELVAELRREVALARSDKLQAEERMLQAVLEASLSLEASCSGGAPSSSTAALAPSAPSADGRLRAQLL